MSKQFLKAKLIRSGKAEILVVENMFEKALSPEVERIFVGCQLNNKKYRRGFLLCGIWSE